MTQLAGVRGLGLAILCAALSGCVSPYTYHGGGDCGPVSLSGRHADCGGMPGNTCDVAPCPADCHQFPVLSALRNMVTCNAGCGRVYWGEWAADPPDACDPCDDGGNWVGSQCCPPRCGFNFWHLLCGTRYQATCPAPACPDCGVAGEASCGAEAVEGEVLDGQWTETIESFETMPNTLGVPPANPLGGASVRDPNSRLVRRNRVPVVH